MENTRNMRWNDTERLNIKQITNYLKSVRSVAQSSPTICNPWTETRQASLSITNSQSLHKLMSITLVIPSNHFSLCYPFLLLPSVFPSIRVFSNELVFRIRWPQYWIFNFSISPSSQYSWLISFRMDWLELLEVQGTQESSPTPQFKSNSSALRFFYSPTLMFTHDYWENQSSDKTDLCWQSNGSAL